jgi:hypothetical protein
MVRAAVVSRWRLREGRYAVVVEGEPWVTSLGGGRPRRKSGSGSSERGMREERRKR